LRVGENRLALRDAEARLAEMIAGARRVAPFTGAGISTECGIPDFRSPGGVWSQFRPIDFQTFLSSPDMRREGLTRFLKVREAVGPVKPGRGHRALARLVAEGKAERIVTQNIDNLHQASGVAAAKVVELHGNGTYAHCLSCGERHELDWVAAELAAKPGAPACVACGGMIKTATISFGQPMPAEAMRIANAEALACDLFLVVGSSLSVFPAAGLPVVAKRNGAALVIINRDPTELDPYADLVINADIGDTLAAVVC
jgi:NAD-dependent deacetylase